MDDASQLVSELQCKLAQLDHKVWKYRRDMAAEFEKYKEDLLRNVPSDVSETVSKAIQASMKDYSSLTPDAPMSDAIESSAAGTDAHSHLPNGSSRTSTSTGTGTSFSKTSSSSSLERASQPNIATAPIMFHRREFETDDGPRSPHEREKEFQGVFTPSYLPLLDSTGRNERRSSYEQTSPLTGPKGEESELSASQVDAGTSTTKSLVSSPEVTRPPTPRRRNTDEVSIASDVSEGPVRRSALRRTSSASKTQSPRRVRFDVEGEEVLPTSSPLPLQSILTSGIPPSSMDDDSGDEAGSEQVENIEQPPPKRVSSSQALRALSRGPLENDGTQWTTVSAPPDGSASIAYSNGTSADSNEDLQTLNREAYHFTPGISDYNGQTQDQDETPSDDDVLGMAPSRPAKGHSSGSANILDSDSMNTNESKSPTASTRNTKSAWKGLESLTTAENGYLGRGLRFDDDEHDELFHFDENTERKGPQEPEDLEDSDPESPIDESRPLSAYSQSPAREIVKRKPATTSAPSKGVVGSYKGHPFSLPIVSDEVHAQAASLGAMNSFVGSVNGRSGVDESDMQSFRASGGVGSFSGTPRSMSERMMLDDLMEAEETKKN